MSSTERFSFDTIQNFDEHISQSIPNYNLLVDAIVSVSEFVVKPESAVIDLGCSTGALLKVIPHNGEKIGIDIAENLLPPNGTNGIEFVKADIRQMAWDFLPSASLVLSIFTMQFVPKHDRLAVLSNVYETLEPDGALVWAEKVVCEEGWQQELMTFSHYDYKQKSFTAEEIMSKEKDLRQIMRCNTTEDNQTLAWNAGFKHSQLLWKFFNFECWIYKKESV